MTAVPRIPAGFPTLSPHLTIKNCAAAIEFYQKTFEAEEVCRCAPDGTTVMYAELKILGSRLMLNDEFPDWQVFGPSTEHPSPTTLHLYVDDADKWFDRAAQNGCTVLAPLMDAFWGDRYGKVQDPFGHRWGIAHQLEVVPPGELDQRAVQWFAKYAQPPADK